MGDFGPAYMPAGRPTSRLYRCDDCSITLPFNAVSDDAHCPSCGGSLRTVGMDGSAASGGGGSGGGGGGQSYIVFVQFQGHVEDECVAKALAELRECAGRVRVLGSYVPAA